MTPWLTRRLALTLVLAALPAMGSGATLEPLIVGWERLFRVDWQVSGGRTGPVLRGRLVNDSPYTVTRIRLLVDALDGAGTVVDQGVTWLAGDLSPFSGVSFEVPAPGRHAGYRVRVFAFDRLQGAGGGGRGVGPGATSVAAARAIEAP
jgi:hypothetical protein